MNSARLPKHRSHDQCRNQYADPEKAGVPEMRGRIDGLGTQCLAEVPGKNRPDRRGDGERQEINRTGRAPLDLVGVTSLMMVYGIMAAPEATPRMNSVSPLGRRVGM